MITSNQVISQITILNYFQKKVIFFVIKIIFMICITDGGGGLYKK